jgi:hypothetical protein
VEYYKTIKRNKSCNMDEADIRVRGFRHEGSTIGECFNIFKAPKQVTYKAKRQGGGYGGARG